MNFTHIVFDMDRTIFDYPAAQLYAFKNSMAEVGIEYSEDIHELYNEYNEQQWRLFEQKKVDMENLQINRFKNFLERLGKKSINAVELNRIYIDLLGKGCFLLPGAEKTVETLSKKYPLAVATNGIASVQRGRLDRSGLFKYFRNIFISEEIGCVKPDVKFFNFMIEKLGAVEPKRVLMVGDSLIADISGAVKAGMSTCWANYDSSYNETDVEPDYEIKKPEELLNIVN